MVERKTVLLVGGSGFLGERIGEILSESGYLIRLLTRSQNPESVALAFPAKVYSWDGLSIPKESIDGTDAVINLAGEPIADGRWTKQKKNTIKKSRVDTTKAVIEAIKQMEHPPRVLVQGSAVGIYGNHTFAKRQENDEAGSDYLAQVCEDWEKPLADLPSETRAIIMRTGVVLGWSGGALMELNSVYAKGVGAQLGSGKQWMNWIHVDDIANFVSKAVKSEEYQGAFNLVAPKNCTNASFHSSFSRYYPISSPFPVPAAILKLTLGEKSSILLTGPQVVPQKLEEMGFEFKYPDIDSALANLFQNITYQGSLVFQSKQYVEKSMENVWPFFSAAKNLERISPPFLQFNIAHQSTPHVEEGTVITYKLKVHSIPVKWRSKITSWEPKKEFVDLQLKGPYKVWHHRHQFHNMASGVQLVDFVQFKLPLMPLSGPVAKFIVDDVRKIFAYRKKVIQKIFAKETK